MSMSGVTLREDVKPALNDLRLKKSRYVILGITPDGQQIAVNEVGPREVTYEEFVKKITTEEPCYAGFDYEYDEDNVTYDKLILVQWVPENAKPRSKMLYSSSRDALSSVSAGFLSVQANEPAELEREEVLRKIKSHRFA